MKKKILTVMASVALLSAGSMMATNSTQVSAKTTKTEKVSSMPDVRYISRTKKRNYLQAGSGKKC